MFMRKLSLFLTFVLFVAFQAAAQNQISGTVTNAETGDPIPGVSIVVEGQTTIGTATDMDGNYTLTGIPEDAEALEFSFVGMEAQVVEIQGRSTINVAMQPAAEELEEIIVVAYGTTKKQSFTGSAESIDSEDLESKNISTLSKGLEGVAPGIQVANSSGQPGADAQIRIRGFGSVNASSSPLYVVDGVPYDGNLNSINPSDIANMTVLKDATATSLYGARGANGVIMITTKSGDGEPEISYNVKQGISARAFPEYERVNSREFVSLQWEAYRRAIFNNDNIDVTLEEAGQFAAEGGEYTDPDGNVSELDHVMNNLGNYNPFDVPMDQVMDPNTGRVSSDANLLWGNNWQDEMFRLGDRGEHNVSLSGEKEGTNYYMSFGYLNEEGIVKNSDFERFNARVNVDSEIRDWLKGGFRLSGSSADQSVFLAEGTYTVNPFYYTRFMGPIYPVYERDEDGNIIRDDQGKKVLDYGAHPNKQRPYAANSNILGQTTLDNRSSKNENVGSRMYLDINFLESLQFTTNFSTDYRNTHGIEHQNALHGDAASFNGRTEKYEVRNISMTFNQLLTYNEEFGRHSVNLLAGHEIYKKNYNYLTATRTGFPFGGLEELATATNMEASNSYRDEYRLESFLSRARYNFDDRYYLSASYRTDGSSRFAEDTRWGNFWSVGGSWRVSEEAFLAGLDWIQDFKVKASYGEQGNDALLDGGSQMYYGYQSFFDIRNNFSYSGFVISSLANPSLQWEVSENLNAGIEFRLFDRLYGEVNYFMKGSDQLLFDFPLPQSTGLGYFKDNVGAMDNRGIEARIGADLIRTDNLRWNLEINGTSFKNEIRELPQEEIITGSKQLKVGRSLYDYYIREYAGVDPENGDALYYKDVLDSEGEPTGERETTNDYGSADRYYVGTAIPDLTGSIGSSLSYKGLNFSFMLTYGLGGKMLDYTYMRMMHSGDYGTHMHADIKDRWQQPGDQTDVPRLENGYNFANGRSDRFLIDKSYLNINNVSISYNIPSKLLSQLGIGMKSLRIFAQGDNLYLFNKLQGMNPQESFSGVTDYQYTPAKTISFGANVKF